MTETKSKMRILKVLGLVLLMLCALCTVVNAYEVENIKIGNEIEDGLIVPNGQKLYIDCEKIIKLLTDTSKLDKLVKSDNYVYDYIYFKLPDGATSAIAEVRPSNSKKELEIVTIENEKYAKYPVAIAVKIEGVYYLGDVFNYKILGNDYTFDAIINFENDTESIEKYDFMIELQNNNQKYFDASIDILKAGDNGELNSIIVGGQGGQAYENSWTYRQSLTGDCYISLKTNTNIGNSVELDKFGTLTLASDRTEPKYDYEYRVLIKDKTIFNKDTIIGKILLPKYNIIKFFALDFQGDLIEEEIKAVAVTNTDADTKIKLDTTTDVVPDGTTLIAEKVTSGDNYNVVVKAVEEDLSKFVLYDISLVNNNVKVQPNGKVKVSIPIPDGYDASKIVVYRVTEDGTKTKLDAAVKGGYITFETDHFSNYVVGEEKTETVEETSTETTNTTDTSKASITIKRELDNTPKTGSETNIITVISSILSIVSAGAIALVKKF